MNNPVVALASVRFTLCLAQRADFIDENSQWRFGTMYFLRSQITHKFDHKPYYLTGSTNKEELGEYFKAKMVYVFRNPLTDIDLQDEIRAVNIATNPVIYENQHTDATPL